MFIRTAFASVIVFGAASAYAQATRNLVGTWVAEVTAPNGVRVTDTSSFDANGGFRNSMKTADGAVLQTLTGRYRYADGQLTLEAGGRTAFSKITWNGDDELVAETNGFRAVYRREKAAGGATPAGPAAPAGPAGALQWQAVKPEAGNGEIFVGRAERSAGAAKSAAAAMAALRERFDGYPKPLATVESSAGGMYVTFGALRAGKPWYGTCWVEVAANGAASVLLSVAPVGEVLPTAPAGPVAPASLRWSDSRTADGAVSVRLPEGWQIGGGQKGSISATGPQGAIDFGIWCTVTTPQLAAQFPLIKYPVVSPFSDPEDVLKRTMPQFSAVSQAAGGPAFRFVQTVEKQPLDWPGAKVALILYDSDVAAAGKVLRRRNLILMSLQDIGDGTFLLYWSGVNADAADFAKNFAVLMEIWNSYKVAGWVHQERLNKAVQSMRETGRIISQVGAARSEAMDRSNRAWSEYIRGTHAIVDDRGRWAEVPNDKVDKIVERLNEGGNGRWRKATPFTDDYWK